MKEHKANIVLLAACVVVCLGIFFYTRSGKKPSLDERSKEAGAQIASRGQPNGYAHNDAALDRIMGKVRGLGLTQEERVALRRIYGKFVEERARLEVAQSRVSETTPDDNIVEIAAFEEAGAKLRQGLFEEIKGVLGEERTKTTLRFAGGAFDQENNFWGKYPQSLLISRDTKTKCFRVVHAINPGVEKEKAFKQTTVSTLSENILLGYEPYRQFLPGKR